MRLSEPYGHLENILRNNVRIEPIRKTTLGLSLNCNNLQEWNVL